MTPPPYSPTVQDADDATVKETLHCIAAMEAYKHKSQEELRFEDYARGRGGINTSGRGGINTPHLLALPRDDFFDIKPNTKPASYSPTSSSDEQGAYMHAITHMQAYRNTSFEELRLKDYRDGRGPPNCTIKQVILPQPPESLHKQLLTQIEEGSVPSHLMEWYKEIVTLVGRGSIPEARDACISKMEAMDARNTPVYAFLAIVLGTILRESSDLGKAMLMFQQAVTIRIHNFGEENLLVARALLELAAALARRGKCDGALFATKRAALILEGLQETSLLPRAYMDRAVLEEELGEDSDASMSFLKVIDIAAEISGVNSNIVNFARDKLLDHYHKKGDYARLASLLEKIDKYVKNDKQEKLARLAQAQEPAPDLAALAINDILPAVPAPCPFKFSVASRGVMLDGTRTSALIPFFSIFNPSMLLSETRVQCYQRVALQFSYDLRAITVGFTIHNPPDLPQYDPFGPNNGYFVFRLPEVTTKSIFFYFKPDGGLYYGYGTVERGCLGQGLPNVEMTAVVILTSAECMVKLTAFDSSNEANNNNIDWNAIKFLSATEQANQNSPIGNQSRTAATNQNSTNGNQSLTAGANQAQNQTNRNSTNVNQSPTAGANQAQNQTNRNSTNVNQSSTAGANQAQNQTNRNSTNVNQSSTTGANRAQNKTNRNSTNVNQSPTAGANEAQNQTNRNSTNVNQSSTAGANQAQNQTNRNSTNVNQSSTTGANQAQNQTNRNSTNVNQSSTAGANLAQNLTNQNSANGNQSTTSGANQAQNQTNRNRTNGNQSTTAGANQAQNQTNRNSTNRDSVRTNQSNSSNQSRSTDEGLLSLSLAELLSEDLSLASPLGFHPKMEQHVKIEQGVVTLQSRRSTYVFSLLPAMINQVYTIEGLNAKKDEAKVLKIGFTTADPDRLELFELPVLTDELSFRHDSWQFERFNMEAGDVMLKVKPFGEVLVAQNMMGLRPLRTPPHQNIWLFIHTDGVVSRFKVDTLCRELSDAILTTDATVASPQTRPLSAQTNAISSQAQRAPFSFDLPQLPTLPLMHSLSIDDFLRSTAALAPQNRTIPATQNRTASATQNRTSPATQNTTSATQSRTAPATQNTTPATQNRTSPATQTRPSENSSASTSENENSVCKICYDNKVEATLLDCGHCMCFKCATTINRDKGICPSCRQVIRQVFKLYMS